MFLSFGLLQNEIKRKKRLYLFCVTGEAKCFFSFKATQCEFFMTHNFASYLRVQHLHAVLAKCKLAKNISFSEAIQMFNRGHYEQGIAIEISYSSKFCFSICEIFFLLPSLDYTFGQSLFTASLTTHHLKKIEQV
jgi:hypothetical protein